MKDKDIYNLIENMENIDDLDLQLDKLIDDEDINLKDIDINKVKLKTYDKIGFKNIKKHKFYKVASIAAMIVAILMIGTPITLAVVNQLYKYDKSSGTVIKTEETMYGLKEPISKQLNDGEVIIRSFIVNPKEQYYEIKEEGKNISGFESLKRSVYLNGKEYGEASFEEVFVGWTLTTGNTDFNYKVGDDLKYVLTFRDKDKKETVLEFDLELNELNTVSDYNRELPTDTSNNITISTLTEEKEDLLYASFIGVPKNENLKFGVCDYGNILKDELGSGIFLTDANDIRVEGEFIFEGTNANKFKFDTKGLTKPYNIEINKVQINSEDYNKTTIKLPKLKFKESKVINKEVKLKNSKNNEFIKDKYKILIKKVERKEVEGIDTYCIEIDYLNNKNQSIKISSLMIESSPSIGSYDFNTASQDIDTDGLFKNINIFLEDEENKNMEGRKKGKYVRFKIAPSDYMVEGDWNLIIK